MKIPMDLTERFRREQERKELRRVFDVCVLGFAAGCAFTVIVIAAVHYFTK